MTDKSTRLMKWIIRTLPVLVVLAAVGWLFLASLPPVEPVATTNESRQEEALDRELSDNVINTEDELHEGCVVSILNRTAKVREDGTWQINNVPVGLGPVRARFTCLEADGRTRSGQSDFFVMEANQVTGFNSKLSEVEPIPVSLSISATATLLTEVGVTSQLTVTATYPDGSTGDVSRQSNGTGYTSSNAAVVTVSADGLLTAMASGAALISVLNEGSLGMMPLQVVLGGDSDGDGIPNDVELANGLDPNNPVDGLEDADQDLLTNQEELMLHGTDFQNPDSDGDTILDGEEVVAGEDGHVTNPLLVDSDNDGLRDALEVTAGSDPTDASDPADYSTVVDSLSITPELFVLTVNSIVGQASQQLSVTGQLIDGSSLDLTSGTLTNTNYSSSDLSVCNFGGAPGEVFGSTDGTCTITATNSGLSAEARGVMETFTPVALTSIQIPTSGYANNVDVVDDQLAFVAAGAAGLQVIDVSNLEGVANLPTDRIIGSLDTTGTAIDVKVVGDLVYLADGGSGLAIIDVSDPTAPTLKGVVDTSGIAQDLVVSGDRAYIADGASGLAIIDVSQPTTPTLVSSISTQGTAKGVAVSGAYAAVAIDSSLKILDVSNESNLQLVGSVGISGGLKDVAVRDNYAYVAAYNGGLQVVDFSTPSSPQIVGGVPGGSAGFVPRDVALSGRFALAAEQIFPNAIPIVDIGDPTNPIFRTTINLSPLGDYAGTGIALTEKFVYVTEESYVVSQDYKATGNTRLFIAQYLGPGKTKMVVDPNPFDLGSVVVGASETRSLNVENSGQGTLLVSKLSLSGNSGNDFAINNPRSFTVAPGASTVISMTFAPSAVTPITGSLIIQSNDPYSPTLTLALLGAGQEPPDITASPDSFAVTLSAGNSTTETLTIGNVGTGPLNFEITLSAATARGMSRVTFEQPAGARTTATNNSNQLVSNAISGKYPVAVGDFTSQASSPVPLTSMTVDPNTGYIYAQQDRSNSFYRYDPFADTWTSLSSAPINSGNNGGAAYLNGKIYTCYTRNGSQIGVYDIASDTWTTIANGLGTGTGNIATDNQYIYMVYSTNLKRYDPASGTWTSLAAPPISFQPWGGLSHFDGTLYGHAGNGRVNFAKYDIATNSWTALSNVPSGAVLGSAIDPQGQVYYAYGSYGGTNWYAFDLVSETWSVSTIPLFSSVSDGGMVHVGQSSVSGIYLLQGEGGTGFGRFETEPYLSWLSVDLTSGTVAPGNSQPVSITISSSGLSSGTYTNTLSITSNDPDQPQLTLPLTLTVTAP